MAFRLVLFAPLRFANTGKVQHIFATHRLFIIVLNTEVRCARMASLNLFALLLLPLVTVGYLIAGSVGQEFEVADDEQCAAPVNWSIYKKDDAGSCNVDSDCDGQPDVVQRTGESPLRNGLPRKCKLRKRGLKCKCNKRNWRMGPWKINFPLATNYGSAATNNRTVPYVLSMSTNRQTCCSACINNNMGTNQRSGVNCNYWLHFVQPGSRKSTCQANPDSCGVCIIFPPGYSPECDPATCTDPTAPNYGLAANMSTVGKGCIEGCDDPHFVGAHGTHFDFNGAPEKSFCLITDSSFQVNMRMTGYYDERTYGASVLKDGKAVRTWIKELGILWLDPASGKQHSLKLAARDGKSQTRDDGFMGSMVLDGAELPRMQPGDQTARDGGLSVSFEGVERLGGAYDVDVYQVTVDKLLSVEVKLRVAHPLLQTESDAMAHINAQFHHIANSESTHGVLGQTFQEGRERRAMDYTALATLMGRSVAADSETGKGFLDGGAADYITPDVLSPDCKFSAFQGSAAPAA